MPKLNRLRRTALRILLAVVLAAVNLTLMAIATEVPASATPTYVQGTTFHANTLATTIAATFGSTTTVGDVIAASYTWDDHLGTSTSCADSSGNSYSVAVMKDDAVNGQAIALCYATVTTAGASTVTVTLPGSLAWRILAIHEYSGLATASPLDVTASNKGTATGGSANSVTSTAATTTVNNDLVVGAFEDISGGVDTVTAGTNFSSRLSASNAGTNEFTMSVITEIPQT